ncbi:MAG: Fe-S cluster assembly ATPase SufC [Ilumatobacteraceae bacterium]
MSTLEIKGLVASVAGKQILNGIDLTVSSGEVHAVMGPNGAGKSTLSAVVMGKPGYEVHAGQVLLDGVDLLGLPTWQRAQAGMHLVMQYPSEVPGVDLTEMMAEAYAARGRGVDGLAADVAAEAARINFPSELLTRSLNVDLSGGEKKRNETLQLALLSPKFAILDELDSGLDIDALRDCARRVEAATHESQLGVLAITHYNRLLEELKPDHVHILVKGRIVASGGPELADQLERDGYEAFTGGADDEPAESTGSSYDDLFSL